jgi:hypothetical protein
MPVPVLPPIGPDLRQWGRQLTIYLQQNLAKLGFKTSADNPSENGVILWDNVNAYPVVSRNNAFVEIVVKVGVPPTSAGTAGDKAGLISWDTNYIYVCNGSYDGSTDIWTRTSHLGGSW